MAGSSLLASLPKVEDAGQDRCGKLWGRRFGGVDDEHRPVGRLELLGGLLVEAGLYLAGAGNALEAGVGAPGREAGGNDRGVGVQEHREVGGWRVAVGRVAGEIAKLGAGRFAGGVGGDAAVCELVGKLAGQGGLANPTWPVA